MKNRWVEDEARSLDALDLLVYRSRLIGSETSLVLWSGGNTSVKLAEIDFRGRSVEVMRIKGSGADLKSIERRHFAGIRLADLEPLFDRTAMIDEEMVPYLSHCVVDPDSPRPSIETLLHGFVPHPHVDHTHADAILALTNTSDPKRHVEAVFGEEAARIPYCRPGFRLARMVGEAARGNPGARCVVLEKHGLITWGDTAKTCYDTTIEMITRAEKYLRERGRDRAAFGAAIHAPLPPAARRRVVSAVAPFLRGLLGRRGEATLSRAVLRFDDTPEVLEFVGSEAGPQIGLGGPATPDHLLYTRARPLCVQGPAPAQLERPEGIEALKQAQARDIEK